MAICVNGLTVCRMFVHIFTLGDMTLPRVTWIFQWTWFIKTFTNILCAWICFATDFFVSELRSLHRDIAQWSATYFQFSTDPETRQHDSQVIHSCARLAAVCTDALSLTCQHVHTV